VSWLLVVLALLATGLAAGVMLGTAIGPAPLALALPYDRYVQLIQYMWPRYDPFMPITNGVALAACAALALVAPQPTTRPLYAVGAVLLIALMVISVTKNVPINRYVMSLDPRHPPADWTARDPRARWRNWNLLRTALAVSAFAASLAGATLPA
jgi:uncharacterized membrane protein